MTLVYIIQVMAHHGVGTEGWRTVRQSSGLPYRFDTYEAAHTALQQHFSNLREGLNVRVHTMGLEDALKPLAGVPPDPSASSVPPLPHQRADPSR
jgi:hypothetical protein